MTEHYNADHFLREVGFRHRLDEPEGEQHHMTPAQTAYRDALVKAAGPRAYAVTNTMGTEQVRITIHRDNAEVARAIINPAGRVLGAWDPEHLIDGIQV